MNAKTRVLLIDDSVVIRRMLSKFVESDPELQLAGFAPTASIGLQKIEQVSPDVVVLDVEMPDMTGIEAVAAIRKKTTKLPILMCSALTHRGAETTIRALSAGATDCIAKPSNVEGGKSVDAFREEFLAKLKSIGHLGRAAESSTSSVSPPPQRVPTMGRPRPRDGRVDAIVIGSSTGGPSVLGELFTRLPGPLPVPLVIVQHMPPVFTKMLAERLSVVSRIPTHEATQGERIEPGHAYIAPGGWHLTVQRQGTEIRAVLNQDPPENSCRPAVDVLFRAAARVWGAGVLGAVLTGMGSDGMLGSTAIAEAGGRVVVQEPKTCVVATMPTSTLSSGAATEALTIEAIAALFAISALGQRKLASAGGSP